LTALGFRDIIKIQSIVTTKFVEIAKEKNATKENWETAKAVLETRANEDGEDGSGDSEVR